MMEESLTPQTPAEAKRHWMIDRLWTAHLFSCFMVLLLVGIIWLGGWRDAVESQRLSWLGLLASGAVAMQILTVLAFSLGGPVGRWRARKGDWSVGADDDDTAARHAYDGGPGA